MIKNAYIIAELSANHNNDFDLAVKTIEEMARSGADAVKVQTYTPDSLAIDVDNVFFGPRKSGLWKGYRPFDLYKEASMPYSWQPRLKEIAEGLGLDFFSSPFDKEGVDFLESINIPIYKIASLEITDLNLIHYVATKQKPIIISTGVADDQDILAAINSCKEAGNNDITLLKCTSEYPAKITDANLAKMLDMKHRFDVKIGLSDHTVGSIVPCAAVAMGATVIEKHYILDRTLGGPDSSFSMEPAEFKSMVDAVRLTEQTIGNVDYTVSDKDKLRRRSLFITRDIAENETLTEENVRSVRPGHGLHPSFLDQAIGSTAKRALKKGEPLLEGDFG